MINMTRPFRALGRWALPFACLAALAGCNGTTQPQASGLVATAAPGSEGARPRPSSSPEIRKIEELGRTIYVLDNAAARATDLAFAEGADLRAPDMRGWVTDTSSSGVLVRFIRQVGGRFEAAYDIKVDETGRATTFTRPANPRLMPEQATQFAARQLALTQANTLLCPGPYVTVTFRDPGASNWRVYLLAATTDPNVRLIGGHRRVLVSADGKRILSSENLSLTCFTPRLEPHAGYRPVFGMVTELLSPTPVETHVFANLLYREPIIVLTRDRRPWGVENGRILELK